MLAQDRTGNEIRDSRLYIYGINQVAVFGRPECCGACFSGFDSRVSVIYFHVYCDAREGA